MSGMYSEKKNNSHNSFQLDELDSGSGILSLIFLALRHQKKHVTSNKNHERRCAHIKKNATVVVCELTGKRNFQ